VLCVKHGRWGVIPSPAVVIVVLKLNACLLALVDIPIKFVDKILHLSLVFNQLLLLAANLLNDVSQLAVLMRKHLVKSYNFIKLLP